MSEVIESAMAAARPKRLAPRNRMAEAKTNRVANAHVGITANLRQKAHAKPRLAYQRRWRFED